MPFEFEDFLQLIFDKNVALCEKQPFAIPYRALLAIAATDTFDKLNAFIHMGNDPEKFFLNLVWAYHYFTQENWRYTNHKLFQNGHEKTLEEFFNTTPPNEFVATNKEKQEEVENQKKIIELEKIIEQNKNELGSATIDSRRFLRTKIKDNEKDVALLKSAGTTRNILAKNLAILGKPEALFIINLLQTMKDSNLEFGNNLAENYQKFRNFFIEEYPQIAPQNFPEQNNIRQQDMTFPQAPNIGNLPNSNETYNANIIGKNILAIKPPRKIEMTKSKGFFAAKISKVATDHINQDIDNFIEIILANSHGKKITIATLASLDSKEEALENYRNTSGKKYKTQFNEDKSEISIFTLKDNKLRQTISFAQIVVPDGKPISITFENFEIIYDLYKKYKKAEEFLVIHCANTVGRAGTLIEIFHLTDLIENEITTSNLALTENGDEGLILNEKNVRSLYENLAISRYENILKNLRNQRVLVQLFSQQQAVFSFAFILAIIDKIITQNNLDFNEKNTQENINNIFDKLPQASHAAMVKDIYFYILKHIQSVPVQKSNDLINEVERNLKIILIERDLQIILYKYDEINILENTKKIIAKLSQLSLANINDIFNRVQLMQKHGDNNLNLMNEIKEISQIILQKTYGEEISTEQKNREIELKNFIKTEITSFILDNYNTKILETASEYKKRCRLFFYDLLKKIQSKLDQNEKLEAEKLEKEKQIKSARDFHEKQYLESRKFNRIKDTINAVCTQIVSYISELSEEEKTEQFILIHELLQEMLNPKHVVQIANQDKNNLVAARIALQSAIQNFAANNPQGIDKYNSKRLLEVTLTALENPEVNHSKHYQEAKQYADISNVEQLTAAVKSKDWSNPIFNHVEMGLITLKAFIDKKITRAELADVAARWQLAFDKVLRDDENVALTIEKQEDIKPTEVGVINYSTGTSEAEKKLFIELLIKIINQDYFKMFFNSHQEYQLEAENWLRDFFNQQEQNQYQLFFNIIELGERKEYAGTHYNFKNNNALFLSGLEKRKLQNIIGELDENEKKVAMEILEKFDKVTKNGFLSIHPNFELMQKIINYIADRFNEKLKNEFEKENIPVKFYYLKTELMPAIGSITSREILHAHAEKIGIFGFTLFKDEVTSVADNDKIPQGDFSKHDINHIGCLMTKPFYDLFAELIENTVIPYFQANEIPDSEESLVNLRYEYLRKFFHRQCNDELLYPFDTNFTELFFANFIEHEFIAPAFNENCNNDDELHENLLLDLRMILLRIIHEIYIQKSKWSTFLDPKEILQKTISELIKTLPNEPKFTDQQDLIIDYLRLFYGKNFLEENKIDLNIELLTDLQEILEAIIKHSQPSTFFGSNESFLLDLNEIVKELQTIQQENLLEKKI